MGREEGDNLLNALLPFAQQMLGKHGEFYPFGGFVDQAGKTGLFAAYDGREQPPSQALIDMMVESFKREGPVMGYRAIGICFDVLATLPGQTSKTDAIQVAIEYSDGEAIDVFLPYSKKWFGRIKYGEVVASRGESKIFK
jgi:hypothetical protein